MGDPHSEQKRRQTALPDEPVPFHFLMGPLMVNFSLGTTATRADQIVRHERLARSIIRFLLSEKWEFCGAVNIGRWRGSNFWLQHCVWGCDVINREGGR